MMLCWCCFIAFQMAKPRAAAGVGHGIFDCDTEKAKTARHFRRAAVNEDADRRNS
jgi:hypothetical protein